MPGGELKAVMEFRFEELGTVFGKVGLLVKPEYKLDLSHVQFKVSPMVEEG